MRKHPCLTCGQEFTRNWNLKRHLVTFHPVEYSNLNIPKTDNSEATLKHPAQNNSYRNHADVHLPDIPKELLESAWRANVYNEVQSIKNTVQSIKQDVQSIITILINNVVK